MPLHLIRFSLLRFLRSYVGLLLLMAVPLCLITVIGIATGQMGNDGEGRTGMDWIAVSFVLSFQLFGGAYTLDSINEDLFRERRWRIRSLPLRIDVYGYSLLAAGTVFSALQGFVLVLFTAWAYGVNWGSLWWVMLVILAVSMPSQLVCLILALTVRHFKTAERLSELYGIGSMVMAGIMFNLPDTPFFRFLSTYCNPISLGQNAVFIRAHETDHTVAYVSVGLLAVASVLLAAVAALLGKKRFA